MRKKPKDPFKHIRHDIEPDIEDEEIEDWDESFFGTKEDE